RTLTQDDPPRLETWRAESWSTDQKPDRSCPRTLARDRRPNPGRRREGASQATPHRHADVSSSPRRKRLPRLLWPGPTLRAAAPTSPSRDLHSLGASSRTTSRGRFQPPTSTSPRAGGSCRSWSPPGLRARKSIIVTHWLYCAWWYSCTRTSLVTLIDLRALTPTRRLFWRFPSSGPRRSSPAWWPPSSSSAASPRKSGGTIPRPSLP